MSELLSPAIEGARHSGGFAYRPEVDGLRAVAVVPVVLFHGGFSLLSGGYVGVDVFFVISGFLITSIILSEQSRGEFSIVGFYERRARRILPALFLVMLACVPMAWWWMTPHYLKSFAQSLVATVLFAPNVYFFLKSGYFESDADEKPLLHTWSLGVEEQYYLLFPWVIIFCRRYGPRALTGVVAATAIGSLTLSEWASWSYPAGNFYLAPTRAWELAVGSLLAIAAVHGAPRRPVDIGVRNLLALLGMFMILFPMAAYDRDTRFPGLYALPPALGSALVIALAQRDTWVGRFLSSRWMVGIGLVSYSMYLWHQPLFAFARLHSVGKPPAWIFACLGLASVVLAYGTWRFVEAPLRDRRRFNRRQVFSMAAAGSAVILALGLTGHFMEGVPHRLSASQQRILAFGDRLENRTEGFPGPECFLPPKQAFTRFDRCVENASAPGPKILLWGDSHAAHLYSGLAAQLVGKSPFTVLTISACPPMPRAQGIGVACRAAGEAILARVLAERPDKVILAAVWGNYDWTALAATIDDLKKAGIAQVEVVGPLPRWLPSLPVILARIDVDFALLPDRTNLGSDSSIGALDRDMRRLTEQHGARFLSAYSALCNEQGCLTRVGSEVDAMMQWDVSHLTRRGSAHLVPLLWPVGPDATNGGVSAAGR